MSLSSVLNSTLSGLTTAQRGLSVISNNIANVQTPGYSRKVLNQESVVLDGQGRGVRTASIERVADEFLRSELRTQGGRLGRSEAVADALDRAQSSVFGAPGNTDQGIDAVLRRLTTSLQSLSQAPESVAARIAVVGDVENSLVELDSAGDRIQSLRAEMDAQIETAVGSANQALQEIEVLNREIVRGGTTPDLMDIRDRRIQELGTLLSIDVQMTSSGAATIYAANGTPLVHQEASLLSYERSSTVSSDTVFAPISVYSPDQYDAQSLEPLAGATGTPLVTGGVRRDLTSELLGDSIADSEQIITSALSDGRIEGLLQARDQFLPELGDQVADLSARLTFELNAAHNLSTALPPPSSLTGTRTDLSGFASATRSGSAYLSIVDSSGSTVSTIAVDLTAATAADLATQIDSDLGALGSAAIDANGRLVMSLTDTSQGLAISSGDGVVEVDVGGVTREANFSHYFGLNDLIVDGTANHCPQLRSDILNDVGNLATARLDVASGPPLAGTLTGPGDMRGVFDLAAVSTSSLSFPAQGGLPAGDFTIGGYVAEMTGLVAARTDQAKQSASIDQAIMDDLEFRNAQRSGVNLDEELTNLVRYQQAYSVSARVMAITNELFEELMSIPG